MEAEGMWLCRRQETPCASTYWQEFVFAPIFWSARAKAASVMHASSFTYSTVWTPFSHI
jgi:hypothetical protein